MPLHPVASAIFDRTHLGELKLVELGSIAEQKVCLVRAAVPQEVPGRTVSTLELNDPHAIIRVAAHDAEVAVIEAADRLEVRRDAVIDHNPLPSSRFERYRLDHLANRIDHHAVSIEAVHRGDYIFITRLDLAFDHSNGVTSKRRKKEEVAPILVEAQRKY